MAEQVFVAILLPVLHLLKGKELIFERRLLVGAAVEGWLVEGADLMLLVVVHLLLVCEIEATADYFV